jgi:hypothetical protein
VAPVLLETTRVQDFERNLRRHGLDPEWYLGELNPDGINPWSMVSTGVPEWYLRREFGRSRAIGQAELPVVAA